MTLLPRLSAPRQNEGRHEIPVIAAGQVSPFPHGYEAVSTVYSCHARPPPVGSVETSTLPSAAPTHRDVDGHERTSTLPADVGFHALAP